MRVFSGKNPGVLAYGSGCVGTNGKVPTIGITGTPKVGQPFTVHLSQALPGTLAILLQGYSSTSWNAFPLPLDLGFLGMGGCKLLAAPQFLSSKFASVGATAGLGKASHTYLVPSPSAAGITAYVQWYATDPGPWFLAALPGRTSGALALTIQP